MTKKKVTISHKEMLDTLQTIHLLREAHDNRAEVDDSEYLGAILYEILSKMHTDETSCTVELAQQERFAVWLCFSSHGFVQLSDVLAAAAWFPLGRGGISF